MTRYAGSMLALSGTATLISVAIAHGQTACSNTIAEPVRVNANFVPDPAGGFVQVLNDCPFEPDACAGMKVKRSAADQTLGCPVRLADPTILVFEQTGRPPLYFVTGTSDDHSTGNFPIYRSDDLINWKFHMFAFRDNTRVGNTGVQCPLPNSGCDDRPNGLYSNGPHRQDCYLLQVSPTRQLKSLWAPQLYLDPSDPVNVYLQFTAVDLTNRGDNRDPQQTLFVARMSRDAFKNQHNHRCQRFQEPIGYGYTESAATEQSFFEGIRDGGALVNRQIPVSGDGQNYSSVLRIDSCNPDGVCVFLPTTDPRFANLGGCCIASALTGGTCCIVTTMADCASQGGAFGGNFTTCPSTSLAYTHAVDDYGLQGASRTWMSLDGSVYFDKFERLPLPSNGSVQRDRPWLLYTWRTCFGAGAGDSAVNYTGNNIDAFPMLSNSLMDSSFVDGPLPMAYRYNTTPSTCPQRGVNDGCSPLIPPTGNPPSARGRLWNGMSGSGNVRLGGCGSLYGVAEAPAVFRRSGVTYLIYSRNGFSSPAYCMVYRAKRGTLRSMMLSQPNDEHVQERLMVSAINRDNPPSRSMGHGEVFRFNRSEDDSNATRPYVIFHVKRVDNINRFVWFKELRFVAPPPPLLESIPGEEPIEEILPIIDDGAYGPEQDARTFIVPFYCPGDFNRVGGVSVQDVFDFLNAYFESDITADINSSDDVTTQDIFDFLNLWNQECVSAPEEGLLD